MFKIVLVATACFGIFATGGECSHLKVVRKRDTSTTKAEELTTTATTTNDRLPAGYFKSHNIPKAVEGCNIKFECKKKLKNAEIPKPCVKFCAKNIECLNGKRSIAPAGICVELDEALVMQEYNDCRKDSPGIMSVALIDFPCQPGYLPDSRGRCREVW